jgi:hypothetical protein
MISTTVIQAALIASLQESGLFESVISHSDSDLGASLAHLRDNPVSIAVIVPGSDEFTHTIDADSGQPLRTAIVGNFDILISGRQLDMRETGDPNTLPLKDRTVELLLWNTLSLPDLVCLPQLCEPMAVQFEDGRGREAWKLTLQTHQLVRS